MIYTSYKRNPPSEYFCNYLKKEFSLNDKAINLCIKHSQLENAPISIILWNFGLITLKQYQLLIDWIHQNKKD
ncbi:MULTISPECIES: DUF2949 domain-containing protein [unclassified Prochlorococcus]|uniref:DUF2949 domain-containing protein n=1 Tax=unclassified Prochlorococcus TaxID=2627481 RepID=UPI00055BC7B6|nr:MULTISPECIES: DUF2949 domain-containing protein [unclassified Prochlorococcus]